jgi:tRNA1(Val) A37 N6-methylase TrmN6
VPPEEQAETTLDGLLGARVRLLQPRRGYRVAVDPVLLAAAVDIGAGEAVLDAGMGTGAAALCLAARVAACSVVGIERDAELAALARASIDLNGLADRVRVIEGDLTDPPAALKESVFDVVMSNPPYLDAARNAAPDDTQRAGAHMQGVPLGLWIDACLRRLRPGGRIAMIHRADRLDDLLGGLSGRAGDLLVIPLWPRAGVAAGRVIVLGRKGARGPLALAAGLVLHEADGGFTQAASAVLREGLALRP